MTTTKDGSTVSVFSKDCLSRQVLLDVTGRWGILVLAALYQRECRFNVLRRRIEGISEKMLSQTLLTLRRDGLVNRHVEASVPPKVTYSLSPLGSTVARRAVELVALLETEVDQFERAWETFEE
ncbi:winged helix-turn-helix transcriptional regulator [Streptomyces sp. NPDC001315]|uniref:winged helix-turn-helix transcriptional regulator n=1 Tax=Streptomyces sp. NPDC001315 TaxID=3364562 RepID=UPI0036B9A9E5